MSDGEPRNVLSCWTRVACGKIDQTRQQVELLERKMRNVLTSYLGINCSKIIFVPYMRHMIW